MFTLAQLLADLAPGASLEGADTLHIRRACVDSRACGAGTLFAALPGERTDGHRFVEAALQAGAVVALVQRTDLLTQARRETAVDLVSGQMPARANAPVVVVVPDVLQALRRAARGRRRAMPTMRVVGVTGSVGKTTTKESLAAVLATRFQVLRSEGNQNNEIGLPLTLLSVEGAPEYAVLEMGMYALGEIAALCDIAEPHIGVVTNVGPVHLERLGSIERIAQAKAELVQALPADGIALLNGDDARVSAMRSQTRARVATYGLRRGSSVWADGIQSLGLSGMRFSAHTECDEALTLAPATCTLTLSALGEQAVLAALPAVALGRIAGLTWEEIQTGLSSLGYGLRLIPVPGLRGSTLLDDSYNASPTATCAALRALAALPRSGDTSGQRIAVLGDMLELGAYEQAGHREVGSCAGQTVDRLMTVGARSREIADEARRVGLAPERIEVLDDPDAAIDTLRNTLEQGDVVLVKGSHSMGMDAVVRALIRPSGEAEATA